MANIAGMYDPNAEPQGDFDPIPAGKYTAEIVESDIVPISKQSEKGNCMALTWKIQGGDYDGRLIWQRLSLWGENMNNLDKVISIAQSQFASITRATGVEAPQDTTELHHRPCELSVSIRKDPNGQYADQNEVKAVKPVGGSGANVGAAQQAAAATPANGGNGQMPWPPKSAA